MYVATEDNSGVIIPVVESILSPVGLDVNVPEVIPVIVGVTVPLSTSQ